MKNKISIIIITAIITSIITWYATYCYYNKLSEDYNESKIRIENLETSLSARLEEIKEKDSKIDKLETIVQEKEAEIDGYKSSKSGKEILINIDD